MEKITELINMNIRLEKCVYPLFNVLDGQTVLNWYYLRNIFTYIGKRFSERILMQASIFCLFVLLAVLFSILSLFGFFHQFIAMVKYLTFLLIF
jgi:hypothetical protein